jgi:hypothetical protein
VSNSRLDRTSKARRSTVERWTDEFNIECRGSAGFCATASRAGQFRALTVLREPAADAEPSEALAMDTGVSRPALARIYTELAGPTRMAYLALSRHDGRRVHDDLDS